MIRSIANSQGTCKERRAPEAPGKPRIAEEWEIAREAGRKIRDFHDSESFVYFLIKMPIS
jgi:hypothetical protein